MLDEDFVEGRLGLGAAPVAVETVDDPASQLALGVVGGSAVGSSSPSRRRKYSSIASSGIDISLPNISAGGSVTPM